MLATMTTDAPQDEKKKKPAPKQAATKKAAPKKEATKKEAPFVEIAGVRVTHPERPLWGDDPLVTKGDLARYVADVAPALLRDLGGRPLSAVRHPRGALAPGFYQKHHTAGLPAAVHFVDDAAFGKVERWLVVDDAAGLVALVQMGTLEFHPWGCFPHRLDVPDRLVIDLDPGDAVSFDDVADSARIVKAAYEDAGLTAFVKSTGGKGLHVCAPLDGSSSWHDVATFGHALAQDLERRSPDRFTANIKKAVRKGKCFVDFLRNLRGSTSIASFSPRARPGAPVSVPLSWSELSSPPSFTVLTAAARATTPTEWSQWTSSARPLPR